MSAIAETKIDYVEIGFRFLKKNKDYGPLAFTSESFLNKLKIPKKLKIALMINGNDYVDNLPKLKKIFVIGLAYDNQIVQNIPAENHDEKMDIILTDKKIYR